MNLTFQFASFSDFMAMGGYAFYVWLAYGVSAVALVALIVHSGRKRKSVIQAIAKKQAREARLR